MKKTTLRKIEKTAKLLLDLFTPHMGYKKNEYKVVQYSCEYDFITYMFIITDFQELTFKYDILNKTWTMQDEWTYKSTTQN